MKMKIVDAIRKASDDDIAKIIGAVIAQHIDGISAEEAIKLDYPNTSKELQSEIEIDYKQTNADRIHSMSVEELAEFLNTVAAFGIKRQYENVSCNSCYERNECAKCWKEWLELETEEGEFWKKVFFP